MPRFKAKIYQVGVNPVVDIPEKITLGFGRRGFVPVKVTLGDFSFAVNLVPVGGGRHRLYLNQTMRHAAGRETGEWVTVALEFDPASRVLKTPPDLARALQEAGQPRGLATLPPSHRKEIIRWVTTAKSPLTRARRIAKVAADFPRVPYRK